MRAFIVKNNPFKTPDAQRLAILFAVVYFSQGMYHVADQTLTLTLKERLGMSAAQVGTFGTVTLVPWVIKPLYGIISDGFPVFGRRRKSYFLITCALATLACLGLSLLGVPTYWTLAGLVIVMGVGFAFTDVLTDAMMVENGKPLGLTGAFQSVQWAAINVATIVVGVIGGYMAEHRSLRGAFLVAACFPVIALVLGAAFIHEIPAKSQREELRETWRGIKRALRERTLWVVTGFIFFWTFSPSIGIPLFYYQTDTLKFSQQFIGLLGSLSAGAAIIGAAFYAPLSRRVSLHQVIVYSIGAGVVGTLAYLLYNSAAAAVAIDTLFGGIGMIIQLAFLDLAAKACPKHAEGTFFALLMSVYNLGVQGSQVTGGFLYDYIGYTPLVLISAAMTALTWLLLPLVNIPDIERRARQAGPPPEMAPVS
ncbi:MAG TPA: MFS transporter [Methylomirabilota bacterium]|nr:MFS transporter [Methylomirabilota bacterium]